MTSSKEKLQELQSQAPASLETETTEQGALKELQLSKLMLISSFLFSLMKDYFFKPPINKLSLNFLDQDLEMAYRTSYQEEVCFSWR